MKITNELLRENAACKTQRELFCELYPDGLKVTRETVKKCVTDKLDVVWAVGNIISVTKEYIRLGVDVNARDNHGWTALMRAAENGKTECVKMLVENGVDVNARDNGGWTALMRAAGNGKTECVKILVENGVDVNARVNGDWTALMRAAEKGKTECVKILESKGGMK